MSRPTVHRGSAASAPGEQRRHLSVPLFLVLVIAYLAVLLLVGQLSSLGDVAHLYTRERVARDLLLPVGASAVFVCAAISVLGWWRPVLVDRQPVRRWVWTIPIAFVAASLIAINYGGLSGKGAAFVALLLLAALCVGIAEEAMFRGIGVITFRANGYTETQVALWSSVVFGLVHLVNAIGSGAGAIGQAVAVSFAGYFFYLTRRVSGGLVVPIIVHTVFDFSLLSGSITPPAYAGGVAAILAYLVAGGVILARRHQIEPPPRP